MTLHQLAVTPNILMTEEDGTVLFTVTADCQGPACPPSIELQEWDATKTKIKSRLQMLDNGMIGDATAGDKIYSRKVEIKETQPKTLFFSIDPNNSATIQITPRPTFFELLEQVWIKIKARLQL